MTPTQHALAVVGDRLYTGLADVTSDLSCLEGRGHWVVAIPFATAPICARFTTVRPARPWPGPGWQGPPQEAWTSSLDESGFKAGVATIREAIAAGDVYQVNLTRRLSAPWPADGDVAALGARLAEGNPAPYAAVIRLPRHGVHIASASPERFLYRHSHIVETKPIKGTAATVDGFLTKDRAENVMIVDLMRNDLGRVCEWGSVAVPALCAVEPHPGLFHLVSTVRGHLRPDVTWAELIEATFPPGSVTGAPKIAACSMIDRLEPVPRGVYCGAIGWVDAEHAHGDLNVAIRTFFWEDGRLCFGTGGGITFDSDPEGEWNETELKARRLIRLASTQGGENEKRTNALHPARDTSGA